MLKQVLMSYWLIVLLSSVICNSSGSDKDVILNYSEENGTTTSSKQPEGNCDAYTVISSDSPGNNVADVTPSVREAAMKLVDGFRDLYSSGRDTLEMPRIEEVSDRRRFVATGGYLGSMASLRTAGDMGVVAKTQYAAEFVLPLELEEFVAGYRQYSLVLPSMSHSGSIKITADRHKIKMNLYVTFANEKCNQLSVKIIPGEIKGINVRLEGAFENDSETKEFLSSLVAERFINNYKLSFNNEIQERFNFLSLNYCV